MTFTFEMFNAGIASCNLSLRVDVSKLAVLVGTFPCISDCGTRACSQSECSTAEEDVLCEFPGAGGGRYARSTEMKL